MNKFELNEEGVRALLKSAEMQVILANEAQARTPSGCESYVKVHQKRAVAYIHPVTKEAYQDNLENNTLLKALG